MVGVDTNEATVWTGSAALRGPRVAPLSSRSVGWVVSVWGSSLGAAGRAVGHERLSRMTRWAMGVVFLLTGSRGRQTPLVHRGWVKE